MNNNNTNSQLIFDNPLLDSILKQASADAMKKLEILQKSKLNQLKVNQIEEKDNENLEFFMENKEIKNKKNQIELDVKDDFTQKYFRDQYGKMIPSNFKTPNAFSLPESQNYDEEPVNKLTEKELLTVIQNRNNINHQESLYRKFNFNKWLMAYLVIKNDKIIKHNKKVDIKEILTFFNGYVFSQRIVGNKDFIIVCEVTNASFLDFLTILSVKDIMEEECDVIIYYTNVDNNIKKLESDIKKGIVMILKNAKMISFIEKKTFLIENISQLKVVY